MVIEFEVNDFPVKHQLSVINIKFSIFSSPIIIVFAKSFEFCLEAAKPLH